MKDEDRHERGEREAEGGAASEPDAGAPASPAPTPSQLVSHPAFRTGVIYIEPELRDEVEAYWKAYAAWERTKQGPPPREPRVNVRVDHEEKPSTAARLREAMAPRKGAARRKSGAEKSGGGSPWAADAAAAAAVIDKSALPSAHRPRSEAAEETDARPGKARRAGTALAMLALAAGIGAAAMCGAKEKAPVESAAVASAPAGSGAASDAAVASGAASDAAVASGAASNAVASSAPTDSTPPAVAERAPERGRPEASAERAASAVVSDREEAVRIARRRPAPETHAPAPTTPAAQMPTAQPSLKQSESVGTGQRVPPMRASSQPPMSPPAAPSQPPSYVEGIPEF